MKSLRGFFVCCGDRPASALILGGTRARQANGGLRAEAGGARGPPLESGKKVGGLRNQAQDMYYIVPVMSCMYLTLLSS